MIKTKSECVGCHGELGCSGSCSYRKVPVTYCDCCGEEAQIYSFNDDNEQLCKDCMTKWLDDLWDNLSYMEKCEIFDIKEIKV